MAAPAPAPETIRRTAAEILSGPDFQIEQETGAGHAMVDLMLQLAEWLIAPFRWLFDAMEGLPDGLRWVVVVSLFILLVALVVHILYVLTSTLRPSTRRSTFSPAMSASRKLGAEDFEQLAHEAIGQRDFISAVRFLFRASLVHLQTLEGRKLSPGLTNRQYVRRYRNSRFVESLQYFVEIIDASWYGNGVCYEEQYVRCREAYAEIKRQTQEGIHADNA